MTRSLSRASDRSARRLRTSELLLHTGRQRTGPRSRHGPSGLQLSDAALAALQAGEWPGNVRQLENAIRHALAVRSPMSDEPVGPELLPGELLNAAPAQLRPAPDVAREDRRALLLRALSSHGGNRTAAAAKHHSLRAVFTPLLIYAMTRCRRGRSCLLRLPSQATRARFSPRQEEIAAR